MGFPVLRLTSVAFDNVYQFLDVPEVIVFSQCSKNMKAIVKSKEGPSKDYSLVVTIEAKNTCVQLQQHDPSFKTLFIWTLYMGKRLLWDSDKVISDDGARIGAVELTMKEADDKWRSTVKKEDYERKILAIVKLFKDIFSCRIGKLILDWDAGASFRKLFMESDELHVVDTMEFYHDFCTQEHMTFMLDHFDAGFLKIISDFGPGFSYSKPLKKFPRLELQYSSWINLSHLLQLAKTGTSIELENSDMITDKDLNQFIKWWIGSDTKDLEVMFLNRSNGNRDITAVMEGIPSTPARKKHDHEIPLFDSILVDWFDKALDICRKDGTQATVMVVDTWFALAVPQKSKPRK